MILAHRVLQTRYGLGIEQVLLAAQAELVLPAHVEFGDILRQRLIRVPVLGDGLPGQRLQIDSLDLGGRAREVLIDDFARQPDRFENLGPMVRLHRGDPHLRHDLQDPFAKGVLEVRPRLLER